MVKVRNFMALAEHFDVITWKEYKRNDVFQKNLKIQMVITAKEKLVYIFHFVSDNGMF